MCTFKLLGQIAPSSNKNGILFKAPEDARVQCSSIMLYNTDMNNPSAVYVKILSEVAECPENHIYYSYIIAPRTSKPKRLVLNLNPGDEVIVSSNTGKVSFSLHGTELN